MRKHTRWTSVVGVLLAGMLVAGCGTEKIGGNGTQGASDTQTGCLQQAGLKLDPRDNDILEVSRGSGSLADIYTFTKPASATDLGKSVAKSGNGSAIGRQVVIYRGSNAGALKDTVEGCMRRFKAPPSTDV